MRIAVVMSAYNGEHYLREQIDSILNQEGIDLELFVRDDGSSDSTLDILKEYESEKVHVLYGSNKGLARSFIECLQGVEGFDYYAFSDQDDFWEKEKLKRAIEKLEGRLEDCNTPAVYYSNLKVSDSNLNVAHVTELQNRRKTLESVSLRSSIAGCTMVLNNALKDVIFSEKITDDALLRGHDHFIICLCYALGGAVCCDQNAYIRYRQHSLNASGGAPIGIAKRIKKEWQALHHDKQDEIKMAGAILDGWGDKLTEKSVSVLSDVANMGSDWKVKLKILFSRDFVTGDIRLTTVEKIKVLFAKNPVRSSKDIV